MRNKIYPTTLNSVLDLIKWKQTNVTLIKYIKIKSNDAQSIGTFFFCLCVLCFGGTQAE